MIIRFMKILLIGTLVLVVVGVGCAALILVNRSKNPSEDELQAARWRELKKAVIIAGTRLVEDPQKTSMDYNAEASRLLGLYNNRNMQFDNPELSKVWAGVETDTNGGLLILQKIGAIDRTKPSNYEILADTFQEDDKGNHDAFWNSMGTRVTLELGKIGLEEQFRDADARLNTSIGGLRGVAEGLSRNDLPNAIAVKYLPSWRGTYWGDTLQIQNTSGSLLADSIVMVTVNLRNGTSFTHAHYVDQWQSGSTLEALYPYIATDYANPQTGNEPDSIGVAVYTSAGTARAEYALTPDEWGKIAKSYCSGLDFSAGHYLASYVESESNERYPAGFQLQFQGLPTLPVKSVEVRFTSDSGSVQAVTFTYKPGAQLTSGEQYPLRSADLDGETPVHIEYLVKFSGTNYEEDVQAY